MNIKTLSKNKVNILGLLAIASSLAIVLHHSGPVKINYTPIVVQNITPHPTNLSPTTIPTPKLQTPPQQKTLTNNYHIYQTFNNCGPAALSMALSYYGINISQQDLGEQLRPYQNPQGNNDDKSVTLQELADQSENYNLLSYYRPNGDINQIKLFITYDIPVVARTLTKVGEDIGHYRVIKGYDDTTGEVIQDDSLQGKNLRFGYSEFNDLWKTFNYEFLVLVPPGKKSAVELILGQNLDEKSAWKVAAQRSQEKFIKNPEDIKAGFNLSVALYKTGDYEGSTKAFEKVQKNLPFRTLWYNIEPIMAYYETGNYEKVFTITNNILSNHNRAFSELYLIRGNIYKKQGDNAEARLEFEKAVFYNKNLQEAKDALLQI